MKLKDYRRLSTPSDWTSKQCKFQIECDKASIVHDHKDNHKAGGQNPFAVSKGPFCPMFYHVTERKRSKINFKCRQRKKCRVGKMAKKEHALGIYRIASIKHPIAHSIKLYFLCIGGAHSLQS